MSIQRYEAHAEGCQGFCGGCAEYAKDGEGEVVLHADHLKEMARSREALQIVLPHLWECKEYKTLAPVVHAALLDAQKEEI
jgi:hypothetical protein